MSSIWKSGQGAKPSWFHRAVLCLYSWRLIIVILSTFVITLSSFYMYLDRKYILDGPYDVAGPKELYEYEKVTIRLLSPPHLKDLQKFVGHYSICPVVDKISILWHSSGDVPKDDVFHYTTTHSKVAFQKVTSDTFWDHYLDESDVNTPGLFVVDAGTLVSCEHLAFGNSVWQSAVDTLVGISPRVIERDNSKKLAIKPPSNVFWGNSYNSLSSDGLFVNKSVLKKLRGSKDILESVTNGKVCADSLIPLYSLAESRQPPIWVDVYAERQGATELLPLSKQLQQFQSGRKDNGDCLSQTFALLNIESLPKSFMKTNMAKDFTVW